MINEFDSIAKKMQADFERSAKLSHSGLKGDARELAIVRNLLGPYLPKKYSIGSGLIADASGSTSKQQDIVIYDGFSIPILQDFDQNKVFFAEQVLSVIEVKSTLSHLEIRDIISKADSVRTLNRAVKSRDSRIFYFGFGFQSRMSLDQIRDYVQRNIHQNNREWRLSAIVVLEDNDGKTGLVTNVDRNSIRSIKVEGTQGDPVATVETKSVGETLLVFYLLLMETFRLTENRIALPNYLSYATTAGFKAIDVRIGKLGGQGLPYQKALQTLKNAQNFSDDEVIRAWYLLIKIAEDNGAGSILASGKFFTIGEERITEGPTPSEVGESIERYVRGSATVEDNSHLKFLVGKLREVAKGNTYLGIC
ncbi:MAG: DUF6602 domain-containing protein [Candidatus Promineifilaceae bacterium]|jgi:hypothetical protein